MVVARTSSGVRLDPAARAKQARITKALSELGLGIAGLGRGEIDALRQGELPMQG